MAKSKPKLNTAYTDPIVWRRFLIIALIGGVIFLKAYLGIIALGLLLAFLFMPIQDYFIRKFKSSGIAAALTSTVAMLVLALPVTIVLVIAFQQTLELIEALNLGSLVSGESNIETEANELALEINEFVENSFGIKEAVSGESVTSFLQTTLPNAIKAITSAIIGIVSGIPSFFTNLIIFLFVFVAGLVSGRDMINTTKQLSPFNKKITDKYILRIGAMAKAMVKGQMLIAVLQGLASAGAMALVGLGDYFFFFALIFTFMSFIPLGAGIITIPLGIAFILFGNVSGGLIILLNHFVVVTNIDNYVRPKVVPKEAQLSAALTILGAFAGVTYFGFLGVIYGPIIMIVITTTIESYIAQSKANNA